MKKFALIVSTALLTAPLLGNPPHCTPDPKAFSRAFTNVAKEATPAVLFLKVESVPSPEDGGLDGTPYDYWGDDFFERFFGMPRGPRGQGPQMQLSQGSGFIVSPDGYVLTNFHVVKGAEKITAVLNDGREVDAKVVGSDPHTDIAIVKIEGKDLPYLTLGNSADMEVGEWVVAIGSPFQLEASVTVGVISAMGRQNLRITDLEDFIQTDAAINPGNSGGPLLNLEGKVIGINTAIVSRSGGYMGIGFAIPSNIVSQVMNQIIENGTVTRGYLGITLQPIDKDIAEAFHLDKPEGVLISEVLKGSPGDKAGLKQGDIVLEINGEPVKSIGAFRNEISFAKPGSTVVLTINRNGKKQKIPVEIGQRSSDMLADQGAVQGLGFEVSELTPDIARQLGYNTPQEGVVVTKIRPGSPAAAAGIRPGFIIMAINHKKVHNIEEFNEALNNLGKEKRILILARSGNMTRFYSLKLE